LEEDEYAVKGAEKKKRFPADIQLRDLRRGPKAAQAADKKEYQGHLSISPRQNLGARQERGGKNAKQVLRGSIHR